MAHRSEKAPTQQAPELNARARTAINEQELRPVVTTHENSQAFFRALGI